MAGARADLPGERSAEVVDRLFDALSGGDVAAAAACCTPDVVVWHAFDQRPMDRAAVIGAWEELVAGFPERAFVDVRRSPVPGGWVQRHQMVARTPTGGRVAWPVTVFVTLRGGRVARIDEYMDRAGRHAPADDDRATPGLPPVRSGSVL